LCFDWYLVAIKLFWGQLLGVCVAVGIAGILLVPFKSVTGLFLLVVAGYCCCCWVTYYSADLLLLVFQYQVHYPEPH